MSRVSIHLEDVEHGTIAMRTDFHNGRHPDSQAHKLAVQILQWMDDQAESKLEPVEETVEMAPKPELSRIIT